jgi:hypothetical protein
MRITKPAPQLRKMIYERPFAASGLDGEFNCTIKVLLLQKLVQFS